MRTSNISSDAYTKQVNDLHIDGSMINFILTHCIADVKKQFKGTQTSYRIFRRSCMGSKVARSIALRELLETALFREAEIFGSIIKEGLDNNANFEKSKDELLMFQNHKQVCNKCDNHYILNIHNSIFCRDL